jgi:hypothetical protein
MKRNRLFYIFVLLTGFLAACSQTDWQGEGELEVQAVQLDKLIGLNGQKLYSDASDMQENEKYCVINPFKMPGQGYHASGIKKQDGGLSYDPLAFTQQSKTASTIGAELKTSFFAGVTSSTATANTAILVVDDFGADNPATLKDETVYTLGNAIFTQRTFGETTVENLQTLGALSHGALVMRVITDEIAGARLGYVLNTSLSTPSKKVYVRTLSDGSQRRLTVIGVNINESLSTSNPKRSDTTLIANEIVKTLGSIAPSTTALGPVVINMSLALLPCRVFTDYENWNKTTPDLQETFEEYMKALFQKNKDIPEAQVTTYSGLVRDIINSTDLWNDPLKRLIAGTNGCPPSNNCSAKRHVYVASSGNYSLNRAMYPANWPGVVSVTGSSVDDPSTKASFFNRGEVMHIAATLRLDPGRGCTIITPCRSVYYIGTSFSAPTVSVYSALDIATLKRCQNPNANAPLPDELLSELAKNAITLVNKPLETFGTTLGAVQVRCGSS